MNEFLRLTLTPENKKDLGRPVYLRRDSILGLGALPNGSTKVWLAVQGYCTVRESVEDILKELR